jgi:hypothetical protein
VTRAELLGGTPFLGFIAAVAFKGQNVAFMVSLTFEIAASAAPGLSRTTSCRPCPCSPTRSTRACS